MALRNRAPRLVCQSSAISIPRRIAFPNTRTYANFQQRLGRERTHGVEPRALAPYASARWHSVSSDAQKSKVYDFNQVKEAVEAPQSGSKVLIDVREPNEFEAGFIPTAVNVPISSQPDALHLSPDDFFERFGFSKPSLDKELIFYCKAGVRSSAAAQFALQNGYVNVAEYRGSWLDWTKNGGSSSKGP